jgi:hypothetical protein
MKNKSVYFLWVLLAFASCTTATQKQDPLVLVEQGLKSLSDLGTVEYVVSKVVQASDDATWYKFGKRKILFSCKASLKAGIDFSELVKDGIKINESRKSISLVLPKAKLMSFNMKPDDIRLAYEKTAITRFSFSNEERDMIMAQGEKDIRDSIVEFGILSDAEKNAKMFLEAFLSQTGYSEIDIQFSKN